MKKQTMRLKLSRTLLLTFLTTALIACAYQEKRWQNYNEQVDLLADTDRQLFLETVQKTLETTPSNTQVSWINSQGVVAGSVVPVRTFQKNSGKFCRIYKATFNESEVSNTPTAAACRNSAGVWEIVKPNKIGH